MIRVPTPADHNHTTARYRRTLQEAFGCDARQAVAMHCASRSRRGTAALAWLAAIAAAALAAWLQVAP